MTDMVQRTPETDEARAMDLSVGRVKQLREMGRELRKEALDDSASRPRRK